MNLKFYLRGLGLGIVVTAIIMTVATNGKEKPLSNEEIMVKAKELGMIENKVLADYDDIQDENIDAVNAGTMEDPAGETAATDEVPDELVQDTDISAEAAIEETEDVAEEQKVEAEPAIFSIKKNELPYSISERLAEAGLVSSADEFDTFLLNNGYDRKIVAAEYVIPIDASEEMIAKIITGEKIE